MWERRSWRHREIEKERQKKRELERERERVGGNNRLWQKKIKDNFENLYKRWHFTTEYVSAV